MDIFCLGGLSADIVVKTPGNLEMGEKTLVKYAGLLPGGFVGNAACAASRLGLNTAWSGQIGTDMYARVLIESFDDFQVNTQYLVQDPDIQTNFCIVMLHENGERTILIIHTHENPPRLTPDILSALQECKIGYTPPYQPEWFKEYAAAVHKGNGLVSIDLETSSGLSQNELEQIISETDIVFTNVKGVARMGGSTLDANIRIIKDLGCEMVVVTRGSEGSSFYRKGETPVHVPGFSTQVIDTTGAGDCFHAAFMKGFLEKWESSEILRYANAAAAICIQEFGPRNGLPMHNDVLKFINTNK